MSADRAGPGGTLPDGAWLPRAGLAPSFKSAITRRVAASRDPLARLRSGRALELYYEAGDPHSQLCAALLRRLLPRLRAPVAIRLVGAPDPTTYPEEARQRGFAALDAARIAPCHGLPDPVAVAPAMLAAMQQRLAAASADAQRFLEVEAQCLRDAAAGSAPGAASGSQPRAQPGPAGADVAALLAANAERRARLGHYLPAMWQYRGEWFWGLDRLDFLKQRLLADGALDGAAPLSQPDGSRLREAAPSSGAPLEFWFSFRSPYSYLAAVELLRERAAGGAHRPLVVRPVLPMVMRGLPVPRVKRLYIVRDAQRCADAAGIPFGRIHDPVGEGVLRVLTAYPWDADAATQLRYCALAAQTSWAEGLDLRRDDVLRSVVERAGLSWAEVQARLARGIDTGAAASNREDLLAAGLWGVPCFRIGAFTTWGQDRLWMVRALAGRDASAARAG